MLNWDGETRKTEPKKQSVEEQKQILMDIFGAHNKKVAKMGMADNRPPVGIKPHKNYQA